MKKLICLCLCITLFSCQDRKNLLNLLFPSTIMIDYDDEQFTVVLQIDNLNTLAKKEVETSSEDAKLLVAIGKGKSIEEAILDIEENQRSVVNLSHIKSIILKPNTIQRDVLKEICNYASYNQELRMDSEVYYTTSPIEDLFSTSFQLSRSQLYILINSSEFKQEALSMYTTNLMQLTKFTDEKNVTIQIPILDIIESKDIYIKQDKTASQKVFDINQILFLNNQQITILNIDDLNGIHWTKSNKNNIELSIENELSAYSSRVTIFLYYSIKDQKYHLKGQVNMVVTRDSKFRTLKELEPLIKQKVHDQIMHTYLIGIQNNVDVYNLQYLSHIANQDTPATEKNFINEIDVKIHLKGSYVGSY